MDIIELLIDDNNEDTGIEAISVVSAPAIESNFVALKNHEVRFAEVNKEKRLLLGAALIPNKPIYRRQGDKEYYVYFSENTIRKAAEFYLMRGNQANATLEHQTELKDLVVVESWIVENPEMDKSKLYGLEGINKGTWVVSMKVNNDEIWNDYVKTGKVKGFSIEGFFIDLAERPKESLKEDLLNDAKLRVIIDLLESENNTELESYSDYPSGVRNNAKRGIELNEKNGNKCATQVGKVRAQQLAAGEPISTETIKRMYSYLSRAEEYYDEGDTKACGTISFLLWGGLAAKRWSESKLKELKLID